APRWADAMRAALAARSARRDVDRSLQQRRRRADVAIPVTRERFRVSRQPGGEAGWAAGDGLWLSADALRHPRQGERGWRQDLGRRTDRARRWGQLGPRLSQCLGN